MAADVNGSPFVEDPGPGIDADQAAARAEEVRSEHDAAAREEGAAVFELPDVDEAKVRHVLFVGGDGLHAAFGVGEYDWMMTARDLDRIAPPLTRILNRYDAAKLVAGFSDEAALAMGAGLWAWRSVLERVAVLRAEERGEAPAMPPPASAERPPPAPAPAPAAAERGGNPPGAGAPRDAAPVAVEVVGGYVTRADRIRQARERRPNAVPAEAPSPFE